MVTHSPIVTKLLALGFGLLGRGDRHLTLMGEEQRGSAGLSSLKLKEKKSPVFRMLPGCWIKWWELLEVGAVKGRVPPSSNSMSWDSLGTDLMSKLY